jgi:hypothetical protein
MAVTDIKKFDNFILQYVEGIGVRDTPYQELRVKSVGLADKYVVEVRLNSARVYSYEGELVKYEYNNVYVSHGMRMVSDSLAETQEYIEVLKEALDVAFEVQKYCILNGWWK